MRPKNEFPDFKKVISTFLSKRAGMDASAISNYEWKMLFKAYWRGASMTEIIGAILDGSAYDTYFLPRERARVKKRRLNENRRT